MDTAVKFQPENAGALRSEVERLKADLERLRLDFSELTQDAVHAAKTGASRARERAEERGAAAAAKGREAVKAVEEEIATHPLLSLATAFTVGMVIGLGLTRKD